MLIADLLDPVALVSAIEDGYVRAREHPTEPLTIYNYAEKAAYEKVWTDVTRTCRGLIVRHDGLVVARPFPKFFNYGEHPEGSLDMDGRVEVTDKEDGSLGILYPTSTGFAIATRGSFISEQARHATALFTERYRSRWVPMAGITYLFEIVYPDNRIVLDYDGLDDLILLGGVAIGTGKVYGLQSGLTEAWPGPRAQMFPARNLAEALTLDPRPNAEGVVVRYVDTDLMLKIKQDDYVRLHRIVTGLNARVVWEATAPDGIGLQALLEPMPDEFRGWAEGVYADLKAKADAIKKDALDAYHQIERATLHEGDADTSERENRAIFAAEATRTDDKRLVPLLFMLYDGRDLAPAIWKGLRPSGEHTPRDFTEDTA